MTAKARFTKADLARAVRVADELGKVALWTPDELATALNLLAFSRPLDVIRPVRFQRLGRKWM